MYYLFQLQTSDRGWIRGKCVFCNHNHRNSPRTRPLFACTSAYVGPIAFTHFFTHLFIRSAVFYLSNISGQSPPTSPDASGWAERPLAPRSLVLRFLLRRLCLRSQMKLSLIKRCFIWSSLVKFMTLFVFPGSHAFPPDHEASSLKVGTGLTCV